jgi:hypothetical protein
MTDEQQQALVARYRPNSEREPAERERLQRCAVQQE